MIWLRHELWQYNDGLGYRLATRKGTDESGATRREGTLKSVFYAPSPAAAKAQYWALRQLGPVIPSRFDSDEPFTLAQLQAQLAEFPDDATLHGQPALHPEDAAGEAGPPVGLLAASASAEALESLEPWPVVAHSEPEQSEEAATDAVAAVEEAPAAAVGPERISREADIEPESNVVPLRIAAANDTTPRSDPGEGRSSAAEVAEPLPLERRAASGSLALALAELGPAAASSGALALALAELEPTPHARPDDVRSEPEASPLALVASHSVSTGDAPETGMSEAAASETGDPVDAAPITGESVQDAGADAAVAGEPLVPEAVAIQAAAAADPLGPIATVTPPRGALARKRRGPGLFGGFLRLLILLIVLAGVILAVGLATGTWDGPTLLARARAMPEQVRGLPLVRTLLPA